MSSSSSLILSTALAVISVALASAGTATPVYTYKFSLPISSTSTVEISSTFSLWEICASALGQSACTTVNLDVICSGAKSHMLAARAFAIGSCLAFGIFGVFIGIRACQPHFLAKPVFLTGWSLCMICSLIAGALSISLATTGQCDSESVLSQEGTSLGPGPILLTVAWVLSLGGLGLEFTIPAGRGGSSSGANRDNEMSNSGAMSYGNANSIAAVHNHHTW